MSRLDVLVGRDSNFQVSVTLPNDIKMQMSIMGKALGKAALDSPLLSRSTNDTKEWRLDCGPASDSSSTSTNGEQCVTNLAKLIGVIVGVFAGVVLISAIVTFLRRRHLRNVLAAQLASGAWPPGTQFILAPAPPPPPDPLDRIGFQMHMAALSQPYF
ncbi:uncharacterized protein ARMOST_01164 [Armillaria ostoyae]|uniref:Uncharacterized protein n=1 Tax=Armillaria ostoyae TaxID=47428 RepID=A0A284QN94_ARMOS|nr:uncharacterized protein ARMOST_01164 [Armillaria ostoyae]